MSYTYAIRTFLKITGLDTATKKAIGADQIVESNVVKHNTKFQKDLENFRLLPDPYKARDSFQLLANGFIMEYTTHIGIKRKHQAPRYFKDHYKQMIDILRQYEDTQYSEVFEECESYWERKLEINKEKLESLFKLIS